jgi:hypothetical protein
MATWTTIALDQAARGWAGALVGVPFEGLVLSPLHVVTVLQGRAGPPTAWGWTFMLLSGPVALALVATGTHLVAGLLRTAGWLRSLALEWVVVALLWLPTALAAAALPKGGGPVAELYAQLGDPQAGRWGALALALLLLWLLAGVVSSRAVAVGRSWMRTDGLEFRRKLVRVVAGYPAAVALGALAIVSGWMAPAWCAGWLVLVFTAQMLRTR